MTPNFSESNGVRFGIFTSFSVSLIVKETEDEEEEDEEPVAKRRHMVSGTLAPLYTVFWLKLGCSGAAAPIGDEVL